MILNPAYTMERRDALRAEWIAQVRELSHWSVDKSVRAARIKFICENVGAELAHLARGQK